MSSETASTQTASSSGVYGCSAHVLDRQRVNELAEHSATNIILVGDHDGLLLTRGLMLLREGYHVTSFSSSRALQASLSHCGLLLICESVPNKTAVALRQMLVLTNPMAKVIRITYSEEDELPVFDSLWIPTNGSRHFISHIAALLMPGNTAA